ncbi:MFS transporter [Williamsia sp. CHRR-6]|uniref:MFS transporter n=1 Tax=Williamsia sp. CHRR-6 TaxID=2835871 RepID=UPI001BDAB60D|nr:MFS transporter [Williamsia sp. CHRR-6]MBT0566765.1 MFS transporter [Williamsia sp. CHRR-6]
MLELLRTRTFVVPWLGQFVSGIGDSAFLVVLVVALAQQSAGLVGLGMAAVSLGAVLSLLAAGFVLDRLSDRTIVIGCDVARFGAALVVWLGLGQSNFVMVVIASGAYGLGQGLYRPSYSALVMELAPDGMLRVANKLRSLGSRSAGLLGAPLGGAISGLGEPRAGILFVSATCLLSVATLVGVRVSVRQGKTDEPVWALATAGVRHVFAHPWQAAWIAQGAIQVSTVIGLVYVATATLLANDSTAFGVVIGAGAAGALAGSVAIPEIKDRSRGRVAVGLVLVQYVEIIALAAGASWVVLAVASLINGYALSWFAVYWVAALQENTEPSAIGRVLAVDALGNQVLSPFGLGFAGFLLAWLGVTDSMIFAGILLAVSVIPVFLVPAAVRMGYSSRGDAVVSDES